MKITLTCLAILGNIWQWGCKDTPPGPPPPPPKDPRTYTWTVDTLQHPESFQTAMRRIWGSSPNNVYVVGHNDVGKRKMYRYDGQRWQVVPITQVEGGPILRPNLDDIFGFSATDIYAVGTRLYENPNPPPQILDSSLIIRFDGVQWSELPTKSQGLWTIAGNSFGIGYTAGHGTIGFVITGGAPQPDTLPVVPPQAASFGVNSVTVAPSGEVYALAAWFENFDSKKYFLHRTSSGQWRVVDTVLIQPGLVENRWGTANVWYSPWGTLYSAGAGMFTWNGNSWNRVFASDSALTGIDGLNPNNIFVVGHFGQLLHYNGTDWFRFTQFANPNLVLWDLIVFENEIFVLGTDAMGHQSFILHGK